MTATNSLVKNINRAEGELINNDGLLSLKNQKDGLKTSLIMSPGTCGSNCNAICPWNLFAHCGNLFRLKWMHFHKVEEFTKVAMNNAAWTGHVEIVKWLHINRNDGCSTDAMDWAASNGQVETVWRILANKPSCSGSCTRL
jgi:hypothetical protein